jgi:hypothetical protein
MKRRHLFDHGYPVTSATQIAGSVVLLAVARHSVRLSKERLAGSHATLVNTCLSLLKARGRALLPALSQGALPHAGVAALPQLRE